jgi:hypothetical protein
VADLSGWRTHAIGVGVSHTVVSADTSVISWGVHATFSPVRSFLCAVVVLWCMGLLCFCVVLWFGPRRAIGVTMAPHVTTVRLAAACGCTRHAGAGDACVDSGPSPTHGELGYGTPTEEVPRSSTVPKIVDQLEGARVRFLLYLPAA